MPGQVYQRIANPYMPQGTSALTNAPTPLYAPGEVGCAFYDPMTGNVCLRVYLDSGATSSTGIGAVKAGQLAFWKVRGYSSGNQQGPIVTNDQTQCDSIATTNGFVNRVAGIFQNSPTAAPGVNNSQGVPEQYACDLIIAGKSVNVWTLAGNATIGCQAVCDTTAATAQVKALATATTAPTSEVIGVFTSSTITSNLAPVDVMLSFVLV